MRVRSAVFTLVAIAALPLLGGCEGRSGSPPDPSEMPFPGSAPSLVALGSGVLDALALGDTLALEGFRLTEQEHNEVIWPELPAARPEVNFPLDLAWQNIQMRNRRDLTRILPWYRERKVAFQDVQCRGEIQVFQTFQVHTDCYVMFADDDLGLLEAQVFKDVAERNGGFKLFRYYDEEPRPARSGER